MEEKKLFSLIVIVLILIAFLILAVLLLFSVSQKRILKEVSSAQAREIEFAENLLKNSIETQENERNRIARELHDGITSKLNVIGLNLNLLKSKLPQNEDDLIFFENIKSSVNASIDLSREISHNLIPPSFSKFGIQSAIDDICIQINRGDEISMEIDINYNWDDLPKMQLLHIFRIIQELINNTIKHANASIIKLKTNNEASLLFISYFDNGVGLKEKTSSNDGIGLTNIKARLKLLKADIIENDPEDIGYHFQFKIPLQ